MGVNEQRVLERLLEHGKNAFQGPAKALPISFKKPPDLNQVQHQEAKSLVNDLEHHPHAFVIACITDRQIDADRAWLIPYRLSQKIGSPGKPTFLFSTLLKLSEDEIQGHMASPPSLHWLYKDMSRHIHAALRRIAEKYEGRTEKIWADCPSSAGLVYRFLEFDGIGPKIATMAANILVRGFKKPVRDYFSIDISPDRHVGRVLHRLDLIPKRASNELIRYRARDLNPQFPGLLDLPAFQIGRKWCRPGQPDCGQCFMQDICPTAARLTA